MQVNGVKTTFMISSVMMIMATETQNTVGRLITLSLYPRVALTTSVTFDPYNGKLTFSETNLRESLAAADYLAVSVVLLAAPGVRLTD